MAFSQDYKLVWNEEFEGPNLNSEFWNIETGYGKNYEEQLYTAASENLKIEDGKLIISAIKNGDQNEYASARINTLNKQQFKYGKIEVKAKLPKGNGTWPAIWMLGINHKTKGYPYCGEIDIMEHVGKSPNELHGAVHYPMQNEELVSYSDMLHIEDLENEYHIFSIEWDREKISYYIDDQEYFKFEISEANQCFKKNVFRKPFYLILNVALGGKWAGEIDNTIFPAQLFVDYIRYYKLE